MTRQELFAYIEAEYNVTPDYPWLESPEGAVFRHGDNRKWFALSMPIPRRYAYPGEPGEVGAVNLKCDPVLSAMVRGEPGILPAYHMSKVHWITVLLDGTADDDRLRFLIRRKSENKKEGIVTAIPSDIFWQNTVIERPSVRADTAAGCPGPTAARRSRPLRRRPKP